MSLAFFAPNKKLTGGSLFVSFNSKDAAIYFRLAKQLDFNLKGGSKFDHENGFSIKMSVDEGAAIIRAVRRNSSTSFYHQFEENVTSGSFKYWKIEPKTEKDTLAEGFGLTVKKGDSEVKIGFSLGGAERLAQYLEFALNHIFSADYAEDKKRNEEYNKKKNEKTESKPASTTKKKTKPVEQESDAISSDGEDDSSGQVEETTENEPDSEHVDF